MPTKSPRSRTRPAQQRRTILPISPNAKTKTWLVALDGANARIYVVSFPAQRLTLTEQSHFAHKGQVSTQHDKAEVHFVRMAGALINTAASHKQFDRLIIAAPPRAMSTLRASLTPATRRLIATEITHEWTKLSQSALLKHLAIALGPTS